MRFVSKQIQVRSLRPGHVILEGGKRLLFLTRNKNVSASRWKQLILTLPLDGGEHVALVKRARETYLTIQVPARSSK